MKKSTVPRILMATGLEENDVRYAAGLVASDPFGLLVDDSRLHLLVSALEAARARKSCPAAVLHTPSELFADDPAPRRRSLNEQMLALVRKLGFRAVQAGLPTSPAGLFYLAAAVPAVSATHCATCAR